MSFADPRKFEPVGTTNLNLNRSYSTAMKDPEPRNVHHPRNNLLEMADSLISVASGLNLADKKGVISYNNGGQLFEKISERKYRLNVEKFKQINKKNLDMYDSIQNAKTSDQIPRKSREGFKRN